MTADGTRVSATNVLILEVASSVRKIGDGRGAPVPVLDLVDSSGPFVALAGTCRHPPTCAGDSLPT